MPLRNRVTPFGTIEALPGRGTFTGNRGIVHNERREIVRRWQVKRWITCLLEFRGWRRPVMQPNRWTQLFFLDEATAFSAGHRPCATCRNADYKRFRAMWESVHGAVSSIDDVDALLHGARLRGREKRTYRARLGELPDGTFVAFDDTAWLIYEGVLHRWSDAGYVERRPIESGKEVDVLTPEPLVAMFAAGYRPVVDASARQAERDLRF